MAPPRVDFKPDLYSPKVFTDLAVEPYSHDTSCVSGCGGVLIYDTHEADDSMCAHPRGHF